MKRWIALGSLVLAALICILLCATAMDPEDFTGEWYCYETQQRFRFQDGLIYGQNSLVPLSAGDAISGAYVFCKDSIVLFAAGVTGLEAEKELYLLERKQEQMLCENPDGSGQIYFIRMID